MNVGIWRLVWRLVWCIAMLFVSLYAIVGIVLAVRANDWPQATTWVLIEIASTFSSFIARIPYRKD